MPHTKSGSYMLRPGHEAVDADAIARHELAAWSGKFLPTHLADADEQVDPLDLLDFAPTQGDKVADEAACPGINVCDSGECEVCPRNELQEVPNDVCWVR